jgi:periplasmic protein TonB
MMAMALLPRDGESLRRLIGRWSGAAGCVALVHAGVAFAVVNSPPPKSTAGDPPAAIMIELAPQPVAPDVPQQNLAVGPQTVMSETSNPSEREDEPVKEETLKPETEPTPQPPEPPVEHEVKSEADVPKLPQMSNAEAVLDPKTPEIEPEKEPEPEKAPETPPEPEKEKVEKTPPKEEKKKEQEEKKPQERKKAAQSTTAPKPTESQRAKTNAAPTSGVSSSTSMASWRGRVGAHINRHKRHPGGGGGTSSVAFTIDRSGRVLSARLIRSSGSAVLDQEAVSLARRASPVPPPPPNIGGGTIVVTVPVRFSR